MSESDLAARVTQALSHNGYLSTAGLARSLGVQRKCVVNAFDEIEAAGIKLHRTHGPEGGAEIDEVWAAGIPLKRAGNGFIGKRMRRAA